VLRDHQQQGQLHHRNENEQQKQAGQHKQLQSVAELNYEIQDIGILPNCPQKEHRDPSRSRCST
jgi:hypothetical protein